VSLSEAQLLELAKTRYGLDRATYTPDEAFAHLSVKQSMGWNLVKHGLLPTIKFGRKKTVIRRIDIVRLLEEPPDRLPSTSGRHSASR
jgi:hypothetical protein